uniref:Cystatin domain-containing protein n=1 Tax=Labrus bergylta TaxID=56723 RepID=A0A3Q3FJT5_9LABR
DRNMMWKLVLLVFFSIGVLGRIGGRDEIDLNQDVEARELLKSAVEEHSQFVDKLEFVTVVEGVKYFFTVTMARTQCLKVDANDKENGLCVVHTDPDEAKPYQCSFTVWVRPWISTSKEFTQTC